MPGKAKKSSKAKKPDRRATRNSLADVSTAALLKELKRRNALPAMPGRMRGAPKTVPMSAGLAAKETAPSKIKATVTGGIRTLGLTVEGKRVQMHQDGSDAAKFEGELNVVVIEPITGAISFFSDSAVLVKLELSIDGTDLDPLHFKSKGGKSGHVPFSIFS
jgi:hypothetical protein